MNILKQINNVFPYTKQDNSTGVYAINEGHLKQETDWAEMSVSIIKVDNREDIAVEVSYSHQIENEVETIMLTKRGCDHRTSKENLHELLLMVVQQIS